MAKVILLDHTTIEFNLLPEVTGADCLEKVAQVMEIKEVGVALCVCVCKLCVCVCV